MMRKKGRGEVVVIQDHQIVCAQFSYKKEGPEVDSVFTHALPQYTIINGIPFVIESLFTILQGSKLPLSLCLFSPFVQERVVQKKNADKNIKREKMQLQHLYREKIPSCCSSQSHWYIATYPYAVIIPFLLCAARAKRNLHTITFPLQSLVSLFHVTDHQYSFNMFLAKRKEREQGSHDEVLSQMQNSKCMPSFFRLSKPQLESNPALWYAVAVACQESQLL
jgi:hypothetical protein